jgi:cytochrome bd-type quinol oxidase subunit 1
MVALQFSPPQFPLLGNGLVVAILFLLHITVAEFTAGAVTLAAYMEWRGLRRGDPRAMRYARGAANTYYLLFSLGATFAVFAVVLLTGLWGNAWGQLLNAFLPLVWFAFGLFLIIAPLLVIYRNYWDRITPVRHAALGTALAVLQNLFIVLIVGIDAYLITPFHSGLLAANLNPPYWPLLLHRLIGNVSWAALFFAGYAAVKLRSSTQPEERAFQVWAARINLRIGLLFALAMPVDGFALILVIDHWQPGFFDNLVAGDTAWMMVLQEALVAVVLVGGNIALAAEAQSSTARVPAVARAAIAVSLAGMVLACLPAAVLQGPIYWIRYLGLGVAVVVTAVHLALRWVGPAARTVAAPVVHSSGVRLGRNALVVVGVSAMATALLMGVIKEKARSPYAVYGELTQAQAQQKYNPPGSLYP